MIQSLHETITRFNLKLALGFINDDSPFENVFVTDPNDEVFNQPLKK